MKSSRSALFQSPRLIILTSFAIATCIFIGCKADPTAGEEYGAPIVSKVDINYLVNGRRPIWMGPVIRYSVYRPTVVEARIISLTGELILVLPLGEQQPGMYTLPWDGTMENGTVTFDGKYLIELYFGDEFAAKFWITAKSLQSFDES